MDLPASVMDFCKRLPKIELHAHLNGSLSKKTLLELSIGSIKNSWEDFSNLQECFEMFSIAHELTKNKEAVMLATLNTIKEFMNDGVIYLELRSTPREEINMNKEEYIRAIINAIVQGRTLYPEIHTALIVSINRGESLKSAHENVHLALKLMKEFPEIVVGVDLSGNPSANSFSLFAPVLQEARKGGLKLAVHCAEIPNEKEVDEILQFGVDRIGHGTCIHPNLKGSSLLWHTLLNKRTPVEVCLTSNIKCRTIPNVTDSHLKYLLEANHPFVLCTDDKGVFDTNLSNEYILAAEKFHLPMELLWKLSLQNVNYSFCSSDTKNDIIQQIELFWNS